MENLCYSNTFSIDSLRIRIPIQEVEILKPIEFDRFELVDKVTNETTAFDRFELKDKITNETTDIKKDSVRLYESGISLYIKKELLRLNSMQGEFMVILINSKQLKERYFEGITKETVSLIYDYIISKEIIRFSYESFINAYCIDVDFKKDIKFKTDFITVTKTLYNNVKPENKKITRPINQKGNQGLEFSKRNITSNQQNPYIKLYNKEIELVNNSDKFNREFLKPHHRHLKRLCRIEYTIKNKKHFEQFGIKDTRLKNLLELSDSKKIEMCQSHLKKHLEYNSIPELVKKDKNLMPNDIIILNSIEIIINNQPNININSLIDILIKDISDREQTILEKRKYIKILYETHLKPHYKSYHKKNEDLENILKVLFE